MVGRWIQWPGRSRRIALPIHIPAQKSGIVSRPISPLPAETLTAGELLVPLAQRPGDPVHPIVSPGDRIPAFVPLVRPDDRRRLVAHSPVAAEVIEITTADTELACDVPAVRLRLLPEPVGEGSPLPASLSRVSSLAPLEAQQLDAALADMARVEGLPATLNSLGVVAMHANQPEPLGNLLERAAGNVGQLVINAIQSEPRLGSHPRLTLDGAEAMVAGIRAMMNYLLLRRATLLVSGALDMPREIVKQHRAARIEVVFIRTGFPGSYEPIVLRELLGKALPPQATSLDARCLLLPADAAWQAGTALLERRPAVLQPLTIAGDCLPPKREGVFLVPVGLPLARVVDAIRRQGALLHEPGQVLLGGRMAGSAIADLERTVVTQTTQGVLLMRSPPQLEVTGCIRCG